MALVIQCNDCGKRYRVSDDKAGARVRCRECDAVLQIPGPDDGAPAPPRPERRSPKRRSRKKRPIARTARAETPRRKTTRSSPVLWIVSTIAFVALTGFGVTLFLLLSRPDASDSPPIASVPPAEPSADSSPPADDTPTTEDAPEPEPAALPTPEPAIPLAAVTVAGQVPLTVSEEHGWSQIPDYLQDAVIYCGASKPGRTVDFTVDDGGLLIMVASWDYDGNRSGGWYETRSTKENLQTEGWSALGTMFRDLGNKDHEYTIFCREVEQGESFRFHTRKYNPPFIITLSADQAKAVSAMLQPEAPPVAVADSEPPSAPQAPPSERSPLTSATAQQTATNPSPETHPPPPSAAVTGAVASGPSQGFLERVKSGAPSFVPENCVAVGVLHPQRIWQQGPVRSLLTAGLGEDDVKYRTAKAIATYGINPSEISELTVFCNPATLKSWARDADIPLPDTETETDVTDQIIDRMYRISLGYNLIYQVHPDRPFPRANGDGAGAHSGLSWRVHMLYHIGHHELHEKFHLDEPWDSVHNRQFIDQMPEIFQTPGVDEAGMTSLHVFTGPGTPFGGSTGASADDITDGEDTILAIVAGPETADIWTKPGGLPFDPTNPRASLGTLTAPQIFVVTMGANGFQIRADVDNAVLARLIQHQDGETVDPFPWYIDWERSARETDTPSFMVRFSKPYDRDAILAAAGANVAQKSHAARTYYEKNWRAVHFIDNRTLIYGAEPTVRGMLNAANRDLPLLEPLRSADPDRDLLVAFNAAKAREIATGLVTRFPGLQPLTQTDSLFLAVNTSPRPDESLLTLTASSADPRTAQSTVRFLLDRYAGVNSLGAFAPALTGLRSGTFATLARRFDLVLDIDSVSRGLTLRAERNQVHIRLPPPTNLNQVPLALNSALTTARASTNAVLRRNALKAMALAAHNCHDVYGSFPRADGDAPGEQTGLSWRVHLLPYLDGAALYQEFHLDEPWDSPHNRTLIDQMPDVFRSEGLSTVGHTAMHVLTGEGTPFGGNVAPRLSDITDGTSNTLMIVMAGADRADIWTKPGGLEFNPADPLAVLGTAPQKGWQAALMDGTVVTLPQNIQPDRFRRLALHRDGEPVTPPGR